MNTFFLSQTATKLKSCVEFLSLFVALQRQQDRINGLSSTCTSLCAAVAAMKIGSSHLNVCANSPDPKTCGNNKRANYGGPPLPPCGVWPPGEEQSSLGSSTPQAPTVITPHPRSNVDTVAAVFEWTALKLVPTLKNAAQLERRAGWRCLEKRSPGKQGRSVACLRGRDRLF